jgi:hypothetical protein
VFLIYHGKELRSGVVPGKEPPPGGAGGEAVASRMGPGAGQRIEQVRAQVGRLYFDQSRWSSFTMRHWP